MNPSVELVEQSARLAQLYGLGIILAIAITGAFFWVLHYVLKTNHEREKGLADIINTTVLALNNSVVKLNETITEANRHQREEHREMMDTLRALKERFH